MTISIFHQNNTVGLATLLVSLQSQLAPEDDIYIADVSSDRSGLRIANLYGSTKCYIFVEVGQYTKEESIKFATQSMLENKQGGLLVINENVVISTTFISNLKRASKLTLNTIVPDAIITPWPKLPTEFKWHNSSTVLLKDTTVFLDSCYFKRSSNKLSLLVNEKVVVFQ